GISPPIANAGSRPSCDRTYATIPVVVVLPCAPATTIESRSETSSARNSARERPTTAGYALDTTTSQPSRTTGSGAILTSTPSRSGRYGGETRSQPPPSAPHAEAIAAYAESPAPPMPTNQIRRPSSGRGKLDQLLGDPRRRMRFGERLHLQTHHAQ